jgi:hypothetical protein
MKSTKILALALTGSILLLAMVVLSYFNISPKKTDEIVEVENQILSSCNLKIDIKTGLEEKLVILGNGYLLDTNSKDACQVIRIGEIVDLKPISTDSNNVTTMYNDYNYPILYYFDNKFIVGLPKQTERLLNYKASYKFSKTKK